MLVIAMLYSVVLPSLASVDFTRASHEHRSLCVQSISGNKHKNIDAVKHTLKQCGQCVVGAGWPRTKPAGVMDSKSVFCEGDQTGFTESALWQYCQIRLVGLIH